MGQLPATTSHRRPAHGLRQQDVFPDVRCIADWPDVALPPSSIDHYTAFVALTHDPKIDDPGSRSRCKSDCFYIGALGSRKTHARRVERLKKERGFTDNDIGRIHSAIGLDIRWLASAFQKLGTFASPRLSMMSR